MLDGAYVMYGFDSVPELSEETGPRAGPPPRGDRPKLFWCRSSVVGLMTHLDELMSAHNIGADLSNGWDGVE